MKRLILVRHATAASERQGVDDWHRPLVDHGQSDAKRLGNTLAEHDVMPESLMSSSAIRASSTAHHLASTLGFPEAEIVCDHDLYTFDERDLLRAIQALPARDATVLLVGHNPACHAVCEILTGVRLDGFATCGAAIMDLDVEAWREVAASCGSLTSFLGRLT
jgi:phosphohistidine phosphatase